MRLSVALYSKKSALLGFRQRINLQIIYHNELKHNDLPLDPPIDEL
jgi:hypothetical protein